VERRGGSVTAVTVDPELAESTVVPVAPAEWVGCSSATAATAVQVDRRPEWRDLAGQVVRVETPGCWAGERPASGAPEAKVERPGWAVMVVLADRRD